MALTRSLFARLAVAAALLSALTACGDVNSSRMRSIAPIPQKLLADMKAKGMTRSSPVLVRVYKQESELEVWKQTSGGKYALLKSYPICRWSGQLGPKKNEGDRQVPEGFYSVSPGQLNPNSKYYLSFDVGYPNTIDRQLGRSGGNIMVHGSCSSRGCFAMTDDQIGEIYAVAREALSAGQPAFQLQSFPFKMTAENMVRHRKNPNIAFWRNLKDGSDSFEVTKRPLDVASCGSRYTFDGVGGESCNMTPDPTVLAAVKSKQASDDARMASLLSSGTQAVSYVYEDGGSNSVFASRSVDVHSVPGRDRPFNRVTEPTVIALNEAGLPASEADHDAAVRASYSAAETLLMSEAAVARRTTGPQSPSAIAKRQAVVYSRLLGKDMPKPQPPVAVAAQVPVAAPVEVAAAAPSGDAAGDSFMGLGSWLGMGGAETATASTGAVVAPVTATAEAPVGTQPAGKLVAGKTVVGKAPVMAEVGPATRPSDMIGKPVLASAGAPPADTSGQPFYRRWLSLDALGLGSEDAAPAETVAPSTVSQPDAAGVPIPPSKPRHASADGVKARDFNSFTSLY